MDYNVKLAPVLFGHTSHRLSMPKAEQRTTLSVFFSERTLCIDPAAPTGEQLTALARGQGHTAGPRVPGDLRS